MGLLQEQMAGRRERIVAAARKLIARRGYAGLSMRELARASGVSVPTLYNLIGSKHAILALEMQATFAELARSFLAIAARGDAVDRATALLESGLERVLAVPRYYRELVNVMLTSPETDELRHTIEERYIAVMAGNLKAGQQAGEIAPWIDADALAGQLFFSFMTAVLGWAKGDLDDAGLRDAARFGQALLLLGVTGEAAAARLQARARQAQQRLAARR